MAREYGPHGFRGGPPERPYDGARPQAPASLQVGRIAGATLTTLAVARAAAGRGRHR